MYKIMQLYRQVITKQQKKMKENIKPEKKIKSEENFILPFTESIIIRHNPTLWIFKQRKKNGKL